MKTIFEQAVKNSFQFLQDKYGFSAPVTEDFGREIFVRYERKDQTLSISYELGSSPMIEIFCPSAETGAEPVPWASKNGVSRSRRFPRIRPSTRFSEEETTMIKYLQEMSAELENAEMNWLTEGKARNSYA